MIDLAAARSSLVPPGCGGVDRFLPPKIRRPTESLPQLGWARFWRDLFVSLFRWHKIEIDRGQGAIDEGFLLACSLQHVLPYKAEHHVDLDARFDDPLGEGERERAVDAVAVLGARPALRGIDNQSRARRLDRRQTATDRTVRDGDLFRMPNKSYSSRTT